MSQENQQAISSSLNTFRNFSVTLIAMGFLYPAVHLTNILSKEGSIFPAVALYLFPALFFGLYFLMNTSKFVKQHIQNLTFGAFLTQTLYFLWLLYVNHAPTDLTFTYYIYLVIAVSIFSSKSHLFAFLSINLIAFCAVLILTQSFSDIPIHISIFWAFAIFFLIYMFINAKLNRERKIIANENQLLDQQEEMNNLLNSITALIAYKDTNNRFIRMNKAMADLMGKPPAFFTNVSLYDIMPKGLAHSYHEEDLSIIRTGKPINDVVEEITTPIGEKRWIRSDKKPYYDKDGNIKGVVIFALDVTDRILAERKLKQSEELFKRIFNEAPYGVFIMDLSNKILHANTSFCQQLGYSELEISTMSLVELTSETDKSRVIDLYNSLSPEFSSTTLEIQFRKKDNGILSSNLFATHIKNEDDIPMYNLGMVENISERREAEAKLKEYSNNLEESNKDLEQFAYIISHDLREPLRMMTSYTQLLKRRYAKNFDDAGNEFMDYIVDGAKRMNNLINDLLSYSRVGRDKRARQFVDMSEIITVVENNLRMAIQESNAKITIKDVMPKVYCNKAQMTTLLQNLIGNAIKYCHPNIAPKVEIGVKRQQDFWEFYIKDNGIGIAVEHLETIFLIFQRLHARDEYTGTGIGLAITKRIAQSHGGDVWVRSVEGEGSTFFLKMPIVSENDIESYNE